MRYRVIGCSRLGDVWLSANHHREFGYDHRVAEMHWIHTTDDVTFGAIEAANKLLEHLEVQDETPSASDSVSEGQGKP